MCQSKDVAPTENTFEVSTATQGHTRSPNVCSYANILYDGGSLCHTNQYILMNSFHFGRDTPGLTGDKLG